MEPKRNYVRILLADDHSMLREGIISMLNNEKDLLVVGEADDGLELIEKYFKLHPDIIITDITMPGLSGTDAVMRIKTKDENVKALFLSMHEGNEYIYYTYKSGGSGLVNKNIIKGELIYAIRTIINDGMYFGPDIDLQKLNEIVDQYENTSKFNKNNFDYDITVREAEILNLIGEGITSTEIAEKLNLSKRTIDTHRSNLIQKLSLKSLPELIRFAVKFNQEMKRQQF